MGDFLSVKKDFSRIGPDQSDRHVKSGRFSSAVRAEQTNDFPFTDLQAQAIDDGFSTIGFDEIIRFEQGAPGCTMTGAFSSLAGALALVVNAERRLENEVFCSWQVFKLWEKLHQFVLFIRCERELDGADSFDILLFCRGSKVM